MKKKSGKRADEHAWRNSRSMTERGPLEGQAGVLSKLLSRKNC